MPSPKDEKYARSLPYMQNLLPGMFAEQNKATAHSLDKTDSVVSSVNWLIRNYNKKLVADGRALSRQQLLSGNIIDLRALLPLDPSNGVSIDPLTAMIKEFFGQYGTDLSKCPLSPFLMSLPPFNCGAFQINRNRYIWYEVVEFDKEKGYTANIRDYLFDKNTGWTPGLALQVSCESNGFTPLEENRLGYTDIYRMFPKERLLNWDKREDTPDADAKTNAPWTEEEYRTWEDTVVRFADESYQKILGMRSQKEYENYDPFWHLAIMYYAAVAKTNITLLKYKVSRPKKENNCSRPAQAKVQAGPTEPAIQKLRYVGPIAVQSEKVPKPPSEERLIHYKTASWPVRGYFRTYKSGKTTYIEPSTRRRKALEASAGGPGTTRMVFREDKDKGGQN